MTALASRTALTYDGENYLATWTEHTIGAIGGPPSRDLTGFGRPYFIFATARPAASYIETVRSQYSTPYFFRILKPSSSHAPGMR